MEKSVLPERKRKSQKMTKFRLYFLNGDTKVVTEKQMGDIDFMCSLPTIFRQEIVSENNKQA